MARAYSASLPQDYGPEQGGDWQTLRSELAALLDQVESQVSRARQDERLDSITERMRDLRHQIVETEPDTRHREALRSVRRAVERFSDRDDYQPAYGASRGPANPRDTLESAIRQIRARQAELAAQPMARAPLPDAAPRMIDSPRFDELAHAVSGISGRLERLESELRGAAKIQTGNVKEIAEQVAQLSHVVELLAGAVGETGQVKRLEGQIAGLAKLVAQGPQVDLSTLTLRLDELASTVGRALEREAVPPPASSDELAIAQRLDDVSAAVGRLADLQVQYANRVDVSAPGGGLKDSLRSIEGAIHAIEDGVRNVYDRIDAIEKSEALPPAALDRVTDELARVTETLRQPAAPEGFAHLMELVEGLSARVGSLESPSSDVSGLKLDMEALRATVVEAVEPRFAAIEMQIEALNERVATTPTADISVSQLEAQVRQLVARMDQTGEQLTGLARLYSTPAEREPAPDFEAMADMVATRASEAVAHTSALVTPSALSGSDIDEIERRVSRLVEAAQAKGQNDDLAGIESSIQAVNERLARLETSLAERARAAEAAEEPAEPIAARTEPPADTVEGGNAVASLLNEAAGAAAQEAQGVPHRRGDAMPASPAVDAPLRDRPFGADTGALKAALEAKNSPRKQHPGLSEEPIAAADSPAMAEGALPRPEDRAFDPGRAERPPRPVSSFDRPDGTFPRDEPSFDDPRAAEPDDAELPPAPSTNTFIAAARRAAMRQQSTATPVAASGSLIARALASFQVGKADAAKADAPKVDDAAEPAARTEKRKTGLKRLLAGDKEPRTAWTPEPVPAEPAEILPQAPEPVALDQEAPHETADVPKESFLSRHRRPILLAASLVAIAFLTLNLINQRLSPSADQATTSTPEPASADVSDAGTAVSPLLAEPIATAANAVSGPRVIPIVDSLATASIDPAAAPGFAPAKAAVSGPAAAFTASALPATPAIDAIETASVPPLAEVVTPLLDELESPVRVEMPPAALGPEALRSAAANGDARAQFEIAAIYTEGRAVPEDLAAAAVWYERSAAQGFAPAQYRLGNLYENGRGVAKDLQQARLWYQRAAEAGNRMAMHNLAALYAGGELGRQQFDTAAEWFEQAARRGMRDSQFNLGMLYARGLGVAQDLEASYRWFSLAARRGDADAEKARDDIARSLDAETVSRLNDELAAFVAADVDLVANFAPIGTWSAKFDPGEAIANREVVKSVQTALAALGFDVGTPDGLAGPKTAEAIKAFERATGMSESGAVNPRLLAVLGSQPV